MRIERDGDAGRVRRRRLGGDRLGQLGEVDRLGQQRVGVDPRSSSRSEASAQPLHLALRRRGAPAGRGDVRRVVRELLAQQLDRALQRGERRAQLVRRGREERLAALLLGVQALAHRSSATATSPTSSRPAPVEGLFDPLVGEPARPAPQPLEAAQQPEAEPDAEPERDGEPGGGRDRQRGPHDRGRRLCVAQRLAQHERPAPGASVDLVTTTASPVDRTRLRVDRRRRPRRRDGRALGVRVGQRLAVRVEQRHPAAHAPLEVAHEPPWRGAPRRRSRAGMRASASRAVPASSRMSCRRSAAMRCCSGGHEGGRGGDERDRAGGDQGERELGAQPGPASARSGHPVARAAHRDDRLAAAAPSFSRRWWTWTSIARGSRNAWSPKTASSRRWRDSSRPAARSSACRTSYSE